jgi:hypothetical protein
MLFGATFVGLLFVGSLGYGIGKIHGYDKWDQENEVFQKGLK